MIPVYIGIALCTFVLVFLLLEDWKLLSRGRKTTGFVFGHRRTMDDGSYSYAPMVRFTDEDQQTIEITDGVYTATKRLSVGDEVTLIYPAGAPHKARVRRPFLKIGIYLPIVALLLLLVARALGWLPQGYDQGPAGL